MKARKDMKKPVALLLLCAALLQGCGHEQKAEITQEESGISAVTPTKTVTELENGLSVVRYDGETGFDEFLSSGGAESDTKVAEFLMGYLKENGISLVVGGFGCSTFSVPSPDGDALFGRNFDWYKCDALIVEAHPENGYTSLSTVNMDFVNEYIKRLPESIRTLVSLYAPLDGMNEKGLCASVLMIEDSDSINQDTDKPDITTTTAIRLLLDKAATVDEAVSLLEQYDMHSSMGWMIHFMLSDAEGNSAAVEYVNGEMVVTDTPVLTNFYLAEGEKHGIGTAQSHERYEILDGLLTETPQMDEDTIRDVLDRVSKHNFHDTETTVWSIVYNKSKGTARYYHREDYTKGYQFALA